MKTLLPFLLVIAACSSERVEIVRESVGCETDVHCNDRDTATMDWCEVSSGFCNHERVVTRTLACETAIDCDDSDATTADACDDGVCVLTRHTTTEVEVEVEVPAPYDPRAYQDLAGYCPRDLTCTSGEGSFVRMQYGGCWTGAPELWRETGYSMVLTLESFPTGLERIQIRPRLLAGDPDDTFRVRVEVDTDADGWPDSAVLVVEKTPAELASDGLIVPVVAPTAEFVNSTNFTINFDFVDRTGYKSRTLQWAIPAGGIMDAATGQDLVPCQLVGSYTDVPEHGMLRLDEGPGGEPRCEGTIRGVEAWSVGYDFPSNLFRSESDSRLYYATDIALPRRLIRFDTMREFVDWFRYPTGTGDPSTICAQVAVYSDAQMVRALAEFVPEVVGTRPGTPVTWFDYESRTQRYGIADRHWTIHDVGTSSAVPFALYCSIYDVVPGLPRTPSCWLDLTGLAPRYRIQSADPTTIDPAAIDTTSGGLLWYNYDF